MADKGLIDSFKCSLEGKGTDELYQLFNDGPADRYMESRKDAILSILSDREKRIDKSGLLVDIKRIIMTTSMSLDGYKVTKTIEIITSECAFGMNIFYDFFASVSDFFGGRSKSTQNVLRDARKACLKELENEARSVGADAVIAVDLDYSEFSGKGKSMLFLVASGTAVKTEKLA